MLACGEDLGLIPSCVHPVCSFYTIFLYPFLVLPNLVSYIIHLELGSLIDHLMQVMQELGLIGLRIQRMPSEPGLEFGVPSQYGYMTVSKLFSICGDLVAILVHAIW